MLENRDINLILNFYSSSEEHINAGSCIRVLKHEIRLYGGDLFNVVTCLPNSVLILHLFMYSQSLCNSHPLIFSCLNHIGPAYFSGSFVLVPTVRYPEMRQQCIFAFYHLNTLHKACALD